MIDIIEIIGIITVFYALIVAWLCLFIAFFFVDKKFRKLLDQHDAVIMETFILMRDINFLLCIAFKNRSKKDRYARLLYNGFDFRGHASRFEIILSYFFVSTIPSIIFSGLCYFLLWSMDALPPEPPL